MVNIFSVEYEIGAQNWRDGQFSLPRKIAEILELKSSDKALIEVTSHKGTKSFVVNIKSGLEVYGLKNHVDSGEFIRVKISKEPMIIE